MGIDEIFWISKIYVLGYYLMLIACNSWRKSEAGTERTRIWRMRVVRTVPLQVLSTNKLPRLANSLPNTGRPLLAPQRMLSRSRNPWGILSCTTKHPCGTTPVRCINLTLEGELLKSQPRTFRLSLEESRFGILVMIFWDFFLFFKNISDAVWT